MRYIVTFQGGDIRECVLEGNTLRHVLHSAARFTLDDPRIKKIVKLEDKE